MAEVGGELWAAIEIDSGAAIADPFRPSGELVDLLRLHAHGERRPERRAARTPAAARGLDTGDDSTRFPPRRRPSGPPSSFPGGR